MIYEIRNYHYEPSLMAEYTTWAKESALPFLRDQLDLVGFWVNVDEPAELRGAPLDDLGSATVTWIIRWPDRATRDETMGRVFTSEAWADIITRHPDRDAYHRVEARFAEAL